MEKLTKTLLIALCILGIALPLCPARAQVLRIVGASTVVPPVNDAAVILKKEQNLTLQVTPVVNSTGEKILALGENQADIALIAKPTTAGQRAPYPDIDFREFQFGEEAAAIVVSKDVWDGGVRALTRDQARDLYEGKIKNWKQIGGPDLALAGFSPDPERGVWACYVQWLYDDPAAIPDSHLAQTKTDDESAADLASTAGSVAQVSLVYAQAKKLHILAIKDDDGKLIEATGANVAAHSYPAARPLIIVTKGRPLGDTSTFVQFMMSPRGQELVRKYDYLTLKELGITPPSF